MFPTLGFSWAFAMPGNSISNIGAEEFRCVGVHNSRGRKAAQKSLKSCVKAAKLGSSWLKRDLKHI